MNLRPDITPFIIYIIFGSVFTDFFIFVCSSYLIFFIAKWQLFNFEVIFLAWGCMSNVTANEKQKRDCKKLQWNMSMKQWWEITDEAAKSEKIMKHVEINTQTELNFRKTSESSVTVMNRRIHSVSWHWVIPGSGSLVNFRIRIQIRHCHNKK